MLSSETVKVSILSISGAVPLRLLDHRFRLVAKGVGAISRRVAPGLYRLEVGFGPSREIRNITVLPEVGYRDHQLVSQVPSAAPVGGTTTAHKFHGKPAEKMSMAPAHRFGTGGRLMVFARMLTPDPQDARQPVDLRGLSLLDESFMPLGDFQEDAREASGSEGDENGWMGWCADVEPGGYVLRWEERSVFRSAEDGAVGLTLDQSLWVQPGWTTIVFLGRYPEEEQLVAQRASIYMARMEEGFLPYGFSDGDEQARLNVALELALTGLRHGKSILDKGLEKQLLYAKFVNPMLGIVGAHSLLQRRQPGWGNFDIVIRNLEKLVPGHPDVVALRLIGKALRGNEAMTRVDPVSWPPMLTASYHGLIKRTWHEQKLVVESSPADLAAANLLSETPWTRWIAYVSEARAQALPEPLPDHTIRQVQIGLDRLEGASEIRIEDVGRASGLPVSSVRRVMKKTGQEVRGL